MKLVLNYTLLAQQKQAEAATIEPDYYYSGMSETILTLIADNDDEDFSYPAGEYFVWSKNQKDPREGKKLAKELCKKYSFNFIDMTVAR